MEFNNVFYIGGAIVIVFLYLLYKVRKLYKKYLQPAVREVSNDLSNSMFEMECALSKHNDKYYKELIVKNDETVLKMENDIKDLNKRSEIEDRSKREEEKKYNKIKNDISRLRREAIDKGDNNAIAELTERENEIDDIHKKIKNQKKFVDWMVYYEYISRKY